MFKEILDLFKRHSALDAIEEDFLSMLDIARDMFERATEPMVTGVVASETEAYVTGRDAKLNELEQSIRRRLYAHLLVSGTADLHPSMAFMSIVKDAERLGDYSKNIHAAVRRMKTANPAPSPAPKLRLREHILLQFTNIRKAVADHDEQKAREIVVLSKRDQAECDQYIWALIEGRNEEVGSENPVASALLFRFFKRMLSHLVNIGTSVYLPLDKLDAFDEPTM